MKFSQVIEEWRTDSRINTDEVGDELAKSYQLQQKYLELLLHFKADMKQREAALAVVRRDRNDYYVGRSEKPSPHRIMKTEADLYINADEEFQRASERVEAARLHVYFLERVLKMIENRSWDLRGMIEWQKMISGGRG